MTLPRPELDNELAAQIAELPLMPKLNPEVLAQMRQYQTAVEPLLEGRAIDLQTIQAYGPEGEPIEASILSPAAEPRSSAAPCVYWIHGGGMVMGDRFSNIDIPLDWLERLGAVIVTVEYRLAPEARGAALVEECYRGLLWLADHAEAFGIDRRRIVVAGISAGGGLAAGVVLMARDRGGPTIAAQILICPMLDHRNTTVSSLQFSGTPGVWTREMNAFAWNALLGDMAESGVPGHVSPALASDFSELPPTFIDVGSAEVFRDECVDYASGIWAAGGQAELHVWPGGFHGFDALLPNARLSRAARRTRSDWLARNLPTLGDDQMLNGDFE